MYIEFSQEFADYFKNNPSSDLLLQILQQACSAMREGQHIVACESRIVAQSICCTAQTISEGRIVRYFHNLYFRHAEIASCKQKVTIFIRVVAPPVKLQRTKLSEQQIIEVAPEIACRSGLWQKTKLLLEDSEDDFFFEQICDYIRAKENILLPYDINSLHGGGTRTANQLHEIQESKSQLCLCIVDSDRHTPSSPFGETASKVQQIYISDYPLVELIILPCHELENLFLSIGILEKITEHDGQMRKTVKIISDIVQKNNNILLFFDLKKGYKKKDIENDLFWKTYLTSYPVITCQRISSCSCTCTPCKGIVVHGFGNSYLAKIKYQGILKQLDCYFNEFHNEVQLMWKALAYNIISWCCNLKMEIQ